MKEARHKGTILCHSTYMRCPEESESQRQKGEWGLLGAGGAGKGHWLFNGDILGGWGPSGDGWRRRSPNDVTATELYA